MSAHSLPLRRLIFPVLWTLVCVGILVGLGSWQIVRMGEKHRLVARVEQRLTAPPVPIPPPAEWSKINTPEHDYLRVSVTGTLMNDREAYLHMLQESGDNAVAGWAVITPMELPNGARVLINRGFVPEERRDPAARPMSQIGTPVTVTGLLRLPEPPSMFSAENNPAKRLFFARDPAAIAAAVGVAPVAPFIIEADATPVPGNWPKGGNTRVSFTDNHLQYAITWFSLAIVVLVMFVIWYRRARNGTEASL